MCNRAYFYTFLLQFCNSYHYAEDNLGCSKWNTPCVNKSQGAAKSSSECLVFCKGQVNDFPVGGTSSSATFHYFPLNTWSQLEKSQNDIFPPFSPHVIYLFFHSHGSFHSTAQHLWIPLIDCFVPASNQSAFFTDTRHLFRAWGVWKETKGKLPITLLWSVWESTHSQSYPLLLISLLYIHPYLMKLFSIIALCWMTAMTWAVK